MRASSEPVGDAPTPGSPGLKPPVAVRSSPPSLRGVPGSAKTRRGPGSVRDKIRLRGLGSPNPRRWVSSRTDPGFNPGAPPARSDEARVYFNTLEPAFTHLK